MTLVCFKSGLAKHEAIMVIPVKEVTSSVEGEELIRGKDGRIFKIREFKMSDLDRVVYINRAVLPENYPPYFFVDHHLAFPKAFLVAELNGEVVGYVMCRVEYGWSYINRGVPVRKGHIISIGVLPHARRIGIAYNLLLRALRVLKRVYDASEAYLEVRVSNTPAISLYKKLGFEIVEVIPRYYHDGEDAYLMARSLDGL